MMQKFILFLKSNSFWSNVDPEDLLPLDEAFFVASFAAKKTELIHR